jgi:hypothetical protein
VRAVTPADFKADFLSPVRDFIQRFIAQVFRNSHPGDMFSGTEANYLTVPVDTFSEVAVLIVKGDSTSHDSPLWVGAFRAQKPYYFWYFL